MNYQPFFIVGCPRSGTTLLQQALNRHSQIVIPPETGFFSLARRSLRIQREHLQRVNEDLHISLPLPFARICGPGQTRAHYEEMARLYVQRLGKGDITHFGEKTPEHLSRLDRIGSAYPTAKIILIYRDGRDVALSLRRLPWTSRDLYVNFALWLYCQRLQRAALRSNRLALHCVRYEDLVNEPKGVLGNVLEFLGLNYETSVAEGEGNVAGIPKWEYLWKASAARKISSERSGLWRQELTQDQVEILERWGGKALQELGYPLLTDARHRLPLLFYPKVALNAALWLLRRPRFGQHKVLWLEKNKQAGGIQEQTPLELESGLRPIGDFP